MTHPHIVLLGDSILDNASYVNAEEPDVRTQVQSLLGTGGTATLLAIDGSVLQGVHNQLNRLPADASHLIVSAGGNDMIMQMGVLTQGAAHVAQALDVIAGVAANFETNYQRMLTAALAHGLPLAVCTIYNPNDPDPVALRVQSTALAVVNDVITRSAAAVGVPVIELRLICTEPSDYANPIEPSAQGGAKIAKAIHHVVQQHDFSSGQTAIYF